MTNDGLNSMVYDAENRATSAAGLAGSATYSYDGKSLRVKKVSGRTTTVYIYSGLPAVAGTKVIAEYENGAAPSAPTREYIYSSGALLAKIESGAVQYYHQDQLSVRLTTDSSGNLIGQQGHYPFGESWYQTNTTTKWLFTSYERDAESGDDYAMARYNVNRLGRFASPDLLAGSRSDPQSLNRYAYVLNDPVNLFDPLGLDDCLVVGADGGCEVAGGGDGGDGGGSGEGGSGGEGWYPWITPFNAPPLWSCSGWSGGSPADGGHFTGCDPVYFPPMFLPGDLGGRGGGGGDPIKKALEKLKDLLKLDKKCTDFLSGKGIDPQQLLGALIDYNKVGQAPIPPIVNPNGTTTVINAETGGPSGNAVTVNTTGAFFNSTFEGARLTEDRGKIRGGTGAARGFILLHELGHLAGVLVPDAGSQSLVDENNKTLEDECAKTINALKQ